MIIRKLRVETKHQTTIPTVAKIVHIHIERIVWIMGKLGLL